MLLTLLSVCGLHSQSARAISRTVPTLDIQSILPVDEHTEFREVKVAPSCGHVKYFTKSIPRAFSYTK